LSKMKERRNKLVEYRPGHSNPEYRSSALASW
jgi:hypothetical protein